MPGDKLPADFFAGDTCSLAKKLLGCELVHESSDGTTAGIIVETEAYLQNDPACHAYNRRTTRTEPMYGPAGHAYVYLIYGMYQCFNVVSNAENIGEAVLIRALQPTQGTELMQLRRKLIKGKSGITIKEKDLPVKDLCRGPGKLVKAMGIERELHNNTALWKAPLYISAPADSAFEIVTTTRIGINVGIELPYRFYVKNNIFVSKF
jgi:DNA-3-methyladenine glycosylase